VALPTFVSLAAVPGTPGFSFSNVLYKNTASSRAPTFSARTPLMPGD